MGQYAAADSQSVAGSPHSSRRQGSSAGCSGPEEPNLQSSVAQHTAGSTQQGNIRSITERGNRAAAPLQEQATGEVSVREEAGADTEEPVASKLEGSSGKQAGMSEGPQQPALQSDLGQEAAFREDGRLLFTVLLDLFSWAGA